MVPHSIGLIVAGKIERVYRSHTADARSLTPKASVVAGKIERVYSSHTTDGFKKV